MEQSIIGDLDIRGDLSRVSIPGPLATALRTLADQGIHPISVDLLPAGRIVVVLPATDAPAAARLPGAGQAEAVVLVTLTGAGLRGDPLIVPTFCEVLTRTTATPVSVAAESGRISAVVAQHQAHRVVAGLREAFELRTAEVLAGQRQTSG